MFLLLDVAPSMASFGLTITDKTSMTIWIWTRVNEVDSLSINQPVNHAVFQ